MNSRNGTVDWMPGSRRPKFKGDMIGYRGKEDLYRWGSSFVVNEKRSHRSKPLNPASCELCHKATNPRSTKPMSALRFGREEYIIVPNSNPIVEGQILIAPNPAYDSGLHRHRRDPTPTDFELAIRMATSGFSNLNCTDIARHRPVVKLIEQGNLEETYTQPYAVYISPLPGSGRSVEHLHINGVPARFVPLPNAEPASWQVCQDRDNGTIFSRLDGTNFYALVVEGKNPQEIGQTLARYHEAMNRWQLPYNFMVYPLNSKSKKGELHGVRIIVVPRDQEYCEAVDQKLAGLEFLTGILIPGPKRLKSMDATLRDSAFWEATLKSDHSLFLERRLRSLFGMPPVGVAVYAVEADSSPNQPKKYRAVVRPNTEFESSDISSWCNLASVTEQPFNEMRLDQEILVRLKCVSICQSDRRVLLGNKASELDRNGGLVLGHEGGGYVVDPGSWKAELQPGEKVVILPHLTDGECKACHSYMQNLCQNMKHIGFHLNGVLAELMSFPYQSVFKVGPDFPEDALPLVEPLACALHAIFRIINQVTNLTNSAATLPSSVNPFVIYGTGPMGCLVARLIKRFWPSIKVKMIEPNKVRRLMVRQNNIADDVVASLPEYEENRISLVASSSFKAALDAISAVQHGGTVILFSGINHKDIVGKEGQWYTWAVTLERIHRSELIVTLEDPLDKRYQLVGTSGYNFDDAKRAVEELRHHYQHYVNVQNVVIHGLQANKARFLSPTQKELNLPNVVETILTPNGIDDEGHGELIAKTCKVLIKL